MTYEEMRDAVDALLEQKVSLATDTRPTKFYSLCRSEQTSVVGEGSIDCSLRPSTS